MENGLIPGPAETEAEFDARCKRATFNDFGPSQEIVNKIFHTFPSWIRIEKGEKPLPFWEAGAAWSDELGNGYIQLGKSRLISPEEVLAHEAVHMMRIRFDEPRFEEILAYQTAKRAWRRWLGPIFRRPWEAYLFLAASFIGAFGLFWVPLSTLVLFLIRLSWDQWVFARARRHAALPLLLRMTDKEIASLGKKSLSELDDGSFRWKQIRASGGGERRGRFGGFFGT